MKLSDYHELYDPFFVSQEIDRFIDRHMDKGLSEEDYIRQFMESLQDWEREHYEDRCISVTNIKEELAFFFFENNLEAFDYAAIKNKKPEYDVVWRRCTIVNGLA